MEVSKETIEGWKKEFGSVYRIDINDVVVYFRTLSRADYVKIMQRQMNEQNFDAELETCKTCILNNVDEKVLLTRGGIIPVLNEQIMSKSGFVVATAEEL